MARVGTAHTVRDVAPNVPPISRVAHNPNPDQPLWDRVRPYALVPLRLFLGWTFLWAGASKLANRKFFDASSYSSIQAQLRSARHGTPLAPFAGAFLHHAVLLGVVLALVEIAVGLATLVGLFPRVAASVGLLISLSFYLTVSWHTRPYYYGSDIAFAFAWTPLALGAPAGWTLSGAINEAAQRHARASRDQYDVRRRVLAGGLLAGGALAFVEMLTAGLAAAVGHVGSSTRRVTRSTSTPSNSGAGIAAGTPVARVSKLPVGGLLEVADPSNGDPVWLLRASATSVVAHSGICTHAGCVVQSVGSGQLQCPCHGSVFDAHSGRPLNGPAFDPLPAYTAAIGQDGQIYLS